RRGGDARRARSGSGCPSPSRRCGCSATCCSSSPGRPDAIHSAMADLEYRIDDFGDRRVLTLQGRTYPPTRYSKRVIEMLVERKQERAPLYFSFKETRGPLYLDPLFGWVG